MILYRHAPPGLPFLWEIAEQPPGRWHGADEGPAHYLADTPDGAWAEFLRHEGITSADELVGIDRAIWAVEVSDDTLTAARRPELPSETLVGGLTTHGPCQAEARRLKDDGAAGVRAPSAALLPGGARGARVDGGLQAGPPRDGEVIVLFGPRPDLLGWQVMETGRPSPDLIQRVRQLSP